MAKPNDDKSADDEPKKDGAPNTINPPEIGKDGKPTKKAVSNGKQARAIAKSIFQKANDGRLKTAALLARKYGGEQPFRPELLAAAGQGWRNNWSAHFLATIVDRVTPQLKDPLSRAETLTHSHLPEKFEDGDRKSEVFRKGITNTIRSWTGWPDFVSSLTQDNVLFGNNAPGWLDDDWRPKSFGYDEIFFPEGTGQHASKVQICIYAQQILLHDFIDKLEDNEAAEAAGYNMEDCAKAANYAASQQADRAEMTELERVDAVRENGVFGAGYSEKVKTVNVWHVLVREYKGGVALWTVSQENDWTLRHVEKLHDKMEEATCMFTLQVGNKKFYGSKGLGRMLANLHTAIERLRCLGADKEYVSGLGILQSDAKNANDIQITVRHPFLIVPKDCVLATEQIEFSAENYRVILNDLVSVAESISGAFIPPNIDNQGSSRTKIEAAQKAERELAVKEGVQGRFFVQTADLISAIQRKICNPDNLAEAQRIYEEKRKREQTGIRMLARKVWEWLQKVGGVFKERNPEPPEESAIADPEAVDAIVSMLSQGLTIEEIATLALSPAGNNVGDSTEELDANTVAFCDANASNPHIDQHEATKLKAEVLLGEDRAKRIVIPDEYDPNVLARESRAQIVEFAMMEAGMPMPVASTDNHKIHRETLAGLFQPIIDAVDQDPQPAPIASLRLDFDHYEAHVIADMELSEEQKKQQIAAIGDYRGKLDQAEAAMLKAAEEQQAQAGALPAPAGGEPPAGALDPAMMLEGAKMGAETAARVTDQELEARRLSLEEKKHEHQVGMDVAELQQQTVAQVREAAKDERDAGIKETAAEQKVEAAKTPPAKKDS